MFENIFLVLFSCLNFPHFVAFFFPPFGFCIRMCFVAPRLKNISGFFNGFFEVLLTKKQELLYGQSTDIVWGSKLRAIKTLLSIKTWSELSASEKEVLFKSYHHQVFKKFIFQVLQTSFENVFTGSTSGPSDSHVVFFSQRVFVRKRGF